MCFHLLTKYLERGMWRTIRRKTNQTQVNKEEEISKTGQKINKIVGKKKVNKTESG